MINENKEKYYKYLIGICFTSFIILIQFNIENVIIILAIFFLVCGFDIVFMDKLDKQARNVGREYLLSIIIGIPILLTLGTYYEDSTRYNRLLAVSVALSYLIRYCIRIASLVIGKYYKKVLK